MATRGRNRLSGSFRAAVFGANDGLVSNLSLILGVGASGVANHVILLTGLAGLLAGALSMGAGEYVSVRSQRELLAASTPDPQAHTILPELDVNANELALLYRSRGMSAEEAEAHALEVLAGRSTVTSGPTVAADVDEHEAVGTGLGAAVSSFCFFASGAAVPVLPYLFGMQGLPAVLVSAGLVGITLLATGAIVGLLSGASPLGRGLRQLLIGYGAAAVTYLLGLLIGGVTGLTAPRNRAVPEFLHDSPPQRLPRRRVARFLRNGARGAVRRPCGCRPPPPRAPLPPSPRPPRRRGGGGGWPRSAA